MIKVLNILFAAKMMILLECYIILPQMSGYIKYFQNGGKYMAFMIGNPDSR